MLIICTCAGDARQSRRPNETPPPIVLERAESASRSHPSSSTVFRILWNWSRGYFRANRARRQLRPGAFYYK
jgi:hypothetical protein